MTKTKSYELNQKTSKLAVALLLALLYALFAAPHSSSQDLPASATSASGPAALASMAAIRAQAKSVFAQLPLRFETNEGQADPQVKFTSQNGAYSLFLSRT